MTLAAARSDAGPSRLHEATPDKAHYASPAVYSSLPTTPPTSPHTSGGPPDNKIYYTLGQQLFCYNVCDKNFESFRATPHTGAIRFLACSSPSEAGDVRPLLATGGDDKRVVIWDRATRSEVKKFDHTKKITAGDFGPGGKKVGDFLRK